MKHEVALKVLKAFRWYFQEKPQSDPDDLTKGQNDAVGVIRHCIDSRLSERTDLKTPKGTYFLATSAGAAVPPWQDGVGTDAQTVIDLGFAVTKIAKADTIIIKGHENCGACEAMFNALLNDVPENTSFATRWMLPVAALGLQGALKAAKSGGAEDKGLLRLIEKTTVLQSMRNLYDYSFDGNSVRDLVDSGKLQIIGAIRSLEKDTKGKQKLFIFDPDRKVFRDINEIYEEAGRPSLEESKAEVTASPPSSKLNVAKIELAIQSMLERIAGSGQIMARL